MSLEGLQLPQMELDPSDKDFLQWLDNHNVEIDGVRTAFTPGKGRGIIATDQIKEGERLVFVPASALLSVPRPNAKNQSQGPSGSRPSVHAALTLKLLFNQTLENSSQSLGLWWKMMPDQYIMKQCMPLMWPEAAQTLLPEQAKAFLEHQKSKLQRDWAYFQSMQLDPSRVGLKSDSSQEAVYDTFAHAWLLVNTRSFYWDYPTAASTASKHLKSKKDSASPKQNSLPTDECMALVPFIDLFNHTFVGESCEVEFNNEGFTVTAGRDYEPGEEIQVSYGNHGNEFLLIEYGFMVEPNVSDTVCLDQYVIPEFNREQKALLETNNLFGHYNLHASTSPSKATPPRYCYRTRCALVVLKLPSSSAQRFIDTGGEFELSTQDSHKLHDMWKHICGHVFEQVMKTKARIEEELEDGAPQEILLARWNQISDMVFETLES